MINISKLACLIAAALMIGVNAQLTVKQLPNVTVPQNYSLTFNIVPLGIITHDYANILHYTMDNQSYTEKSRVPGIWFAPRTLKLMFKFSTTYSTVDEGLDIAEALPLNFNTTVQLVALGKTVTVYFNGKYKGSKLLLGTRYDGTSILYASDPWNTPARAILSGLRMQAISSPFIPPVTTASPYICSPATCVSPYKCVLGVCDSSTVQFTSTKANISQLQFVGTDNSPAAESWATRVNWDGVPIPRYNLTTSGSTFADWMCGKNGPTGNGHVLKGLHSVYEAATPFANPFSPTIQEIDFWHRTVIRHFRRMLGVSESSSPFGMDPCCSARALWGIEYRFTTLWGNNSATCATNAHCGSKFFPTAVQQEPYFDQFAGDYPTCTGLGEWSEGVFSSKPDINWTFKLSRAICDVIRAEGYNGSHVRPFIRRTVGGMAFYNSKWLNLSNDNTEIRIKWTGDEKCPTAVYGFEADGITPKSTC